MFENIRVGPEDFDVGSELKQLHDSNPKIGATCSFVGYVRDFGDIDGVRKMELEHYPGMTEKALQSIASEAGSRWELDGLTIIHRVGVLSPADQIVLVICASAHRSDAFSACEYIMDYLKIRAPFWKKEVTSEGAQWVDAKGSDNKKAADWEVKH